MSSPNSQLSSPALSSASSPSASSSASSVSSPGETTVDPQELFIDDGKTNAGLGEVLKDFAEREGGRSDPKFSGVFLGARNRKGGGILGKKKKFSWLKLRIEKAGEMEGEGDEALRVHLEESEPWVCPEVLQAGVGVTSTKGKLQAIKAAKKDDTKKGGAIFGNTVGETLKRPFYIYWGCNTCYTILADKSIGTEFLKCKGV